ncbi:MAG: hypothetical protein HY770_05100, partial [Chitinivibrionia bacterium]|nr:hypothetical protein [Chitinivibrionia bacterium]
HIYSESEIPALPGDPKDRHGSKASQTAVFDACILAFAQSGGAIYTHYDSLLIPISCTDIFGNVDGDWTPALANSYGQNGNFAADPLFCNQAAGLYTLTANSRCAPANNSCGKRIGARDVGCAALSFVVTPTPINFDVKYMAGNPAPQDIQITNGGGNVLSWTARHNAAWLFPSALEGTAPSTISLNVDVTGLAIGTFYDLR